MADQYAIIVAAGSGTRMKSDTPKQFLEIAGLPVLMHTIQAFYRYNKNLKIITVLSENDLATWEELCIKHNFTIETEIRKGGETRFESVQNGINAIGDKGVVAIHDGVRPIIDQGIIAASFSIASVHGSAIASVRLKESLRKIDKDHTKKVDRSIYRLIQTPQTFQIPIIKHAYEVAEGADFTDDASVVESAGFKISLFEGSYKNIKITTPEDLAIANTFLMNN